MKFGLPSQFLDLVMSVGNTNPKVEQIILFGSRATGQYRNRSDVDLALIGKQLTIDDIIQFERQLETLDILNKFEVLLFDNISSTELKEQIITIGIQLYSKAGHVIGVN